MRDLREIVADNGNDTTVDPETARNINLVEGEAVRCEVCGRTTDTCESPAVGFFGFIDCE